MDPLYAIPICSSSPPLPSPPLPRGCLLPFIHHSSFPFASDLWTEWVGTAGNLQSWWKKVVTENLLGLEKWSCRPWEAQGSPGLGCWGVTCWDGQWGVLGSRQSTDSPFCVVREAACSLGQICLLRESGLIKLQLKRKKRMLGRASPGLSSSAWAGVWRNNLQRNKRHTGIPETWLADGADAVFTRGGLGERSLQMGVNRRGCKTGGRLLGKLSLEQSFLSLGSTGIWWRGGGGGGDFCWVGDCPVQCRGLKSTLDSPTRCDNQKRCQTLSNVPWGAKSAPLHHLLKTTSFRLRHWSWIFRAWVYLRCRLSFLS